MNGDCATGKAVQSYDFGYDGDGIRTRTTSNGYDEKGSPLAAQVTAYYFGGSYETHSDGKVLKYYSFAGQSVAMRDDSGLQYFLSDHLGSVMAITDSSGTLTSQQRYLPFGQTRSAVGSITQTDFGYTGQRELDSQIGLMDYKARFYSSALGRFVQPDNIIPSPSNPQSFNRYSYVMNNPIRYNDPSGHFADVALDFAFILMDVAFIAKDGWTPENTAALALDIVCASIPFVTGGGLLIHGGAAITRAAVKVPAVIKAGQATEKGLQLLKISTEGGGNDATSGNGTKSSNENGTNNFADEEVLQDHFLEHGAELGYRTAKEYLDGARNLIKGGKGIETFFRKSDGATLFYNKSTNEFGVLHKNGRIGSYFAPSEGAYYWLKKIGKKK